MVQIGGKIGIRTFSIEYTILKHYNQKNRPMMDINSSMWPIFTCMSAVPQEAIQKFHKCVPSVVLLDSRMPGMNGVKVAEILKAVSPELPIIMISSYSEQRFNKQEHQRPYRGRDNILTFLYVKPY